MKLWIAEWSAIIGLRLLMLAKAIHPVMFATLQDALTDALQGNDLERYRKPQPDHNETVTSSNLPD
jgi:hypothetical protein